MRVAIYYPWVYLTSGVERTIAEIAKRSKHKVTIFTNHFDPKNTYADFKDLKVIQLAYIPVARNIFSVTRAAVTIALQKIDLSSFNALLVHSDGLGDLILSLNRNIPVVCFCHTPLRPVFDKDYRKRILKDYRGIWRICFLVTSIAFKIIDQLLWRNYQYVIFNSKESLRRAKTGGLLRFFTRRYEILHPGVAHYKPSWKYKPYFLIAGRIMWTKNIELGIQSFIRFKRVHPNCSAFRLIIAGQVDQKSKAYLKKLIRITRTRKDINLVIFPSEKRLKKLYSYCWTVVLTSFNEDWGLTLLEANAHGKPTIAVNRGGPKESQLHGITGYLLRPNAAEFSKKMALLAQNKTLTNNMGHQAYINSKKYNWSSFVKKLDTVLDTVINAQKTLPLVSRIKENLL